MLLQAEREGGGHGDLALEDYLELCWLELVVWEKRIPVLPPLPDL